MRNASPHFLPLNTRKGALVTYVKDKEAKCLTEDQARHIYKKVESDSMININTRKQEIEDDKLNRDRIEEDEINPYQKVVLNNVYREDVKTAQMEHWSIMSDILRYVQHDKDPKTLCELNVETLHYRNHKEL